MPLAHLSDRAVVRMSGADTRAFLQGQLTNDIALLRADAPLYAGILTPQGKALFAIFLFADGDDVLIDCAEGQADALVARLLQFRLRRQFTLERAGDLGLFAAWGPDAEGDAPGRPFDPRTPAAGRRFVAAPGSIAANAILEDWHAHRLPLGLPEPDEIGSGALMWLETNGAELSGTSFTKGCYTGQENVARMHYRDKLRRRLLPFAVGDDPPPGPIMAGERVAAELCGAPHQGMQMALARVEHLGSPLTLGGRPVAPVRPPWLSLAEA